MQPFKIVECGWENMVQETAGQGHGHHDQEDTFELPTHSNFLSGLAVVLKFSQQVAEGLLQVFMAKGVTGVLQFVGGDPATAE